MRDIQSSKNLIRRAENVIAGGVVSMNRKVSPHIVFEKGKGAYIYDIDGNRFIDYHAAFAPIVLGHNDIDVNKAVKKAMDADWSLMGSGTTKWEIELAETITSIIPSLETIQIANTGSEATAHAIRLSRAFTKREKILVHLGGYNGWHNDVVRSVMPPLNEIGSRVSPGEYRFHSMSAGVPEGVKEKVHVINFNELESVEHVLKKYPIACILAEPVLQNIGVIKPEEGYWKKVRELCDRYGTLLIFDEVKTGFRAALGGYQSICKVVPDLSVFGKAIANGYPIAVIGGKSQIMKQFAETNLKKRVLIAGTYNAHPFPTVAANATLKKLMENDGQIYKTLEILGKKLEKGIDAIFQSKGIPAITSRVGSSFCTYFCDHLPKDYHDLAASHDYELDLTFRKLLIDKGIYQVPVATKQGSISASHTEKIIDQTLNITREIVMTL